MAWYIFEHKRPNVKQLQRAEIGIALCSEQSSQSTYDMFLFDGKNKDKRYVPKKSSEFKENNEGIASPQTSEFHKKVQCA